MFAIRKSSALLKPVNSLYSSILLKTDKQKSAGNRDLRNPAILQCWRLFFYFRPVKESEQHFLSDVIFKFFLHEGQGC